MRLRPLAPCLLLLLVAPARPPRAEEGRLLRLDLQAGRSYRYALTQSQDTELDLGGLGRQHTRTRTRFELAYRVKATAPDGSTTIAATFDRIGLEMEAQGNTMRFDTADDPSGDEANPLASFQRLLVGKSLLVTMTPVGVIARVGGFDEIWDEISGKLPADPGTRQTLSLMKAGFGEDAMKAMLQLGSAVLPPEPVRTGERWTHAATIDHPVLGRMRIRTEYESLGSEGRRGRGCEKISAATRIEFDGSGPRLDPLARLFSAVGADVDVSSEIGDADGHGTLWVDRATGLTVESEQVQQLALSLTLAAGEEGGGKTEIGMNVRQEIRLEMLD